VRTAPAPYSPPVGQTERFHDAEVAAAAQDGPVALSPGLRMLAVRTPTLPPATHTNVFLVGAGDAVLVEPASPYTEEVDRVAAWVDEARQTGVTVRAIVATHHHPDHIGGAVVLRERLGLPLWAHEATQTCLAGRVPVDRTLADGETIHLHGGAGVPDMALTAVHTPGHAPGHLCFLEPTSGQMIAGDMVAGIGTILIAPDEGDMAAYLASLERMIEAGATTLLPAHGGPIRDAAGCVDRYVAHRLARERRVLDALRAHGGPATAAELLPAAYDDAPKAFWPLAVQSIMAHLDKLAREGKARRVGAGRFEAGPASTH
jgi:endoribonuclease LACTB2